MVKQKSMLKVIFIAGTGRCGSTLLDSTLASIPGVFSAGEFRFLWKRGILENRLCGTGEPFAKNETWNRIVEKLYGAEKHSKSLYFERMEADLRIRRMMGLKTPSKQNQLRQDVQAYANELKKCLHTTADEFNTNIIIDSSKKPMHGFALSQIDDIDLRIIHLIRDRKAVVHSWNTSKYDKSKGGMMNTQSVKKASIEWVLINRWIERYLDTGKHPYMKIFYSEFTKNPSLVLGNILRFIGEDHENNIIDENNSFKPVPSPTISGNPMRFTKGKIIIKEDKRWLSDMSFLNKLKSDLYSTAAHLSFFL